MTALDMKTPLWGLLYINAFTHCLSQKWMHNLEVTYKYIDLYTSGHRVCLAKMSKYLNEPASCGRYQDKA